MLENKRVEIDEIFDDTSQEKESMIRDMLREARQVGFDEGYKEKEKMATQQKIGIEEETVFPAGDTEYKNKVVFLRKSKKGAHLYAFNRDGALGGGIESILMDISEVQRLIEGSTDWIKVSVMETKEEE